MASERKSESKLRRWCPIAGTHQDADDPDCNWLDCLESTPRHRLRLRRMLVCSECEQGYFTRKDFDAHGCHDAY